MKGELRWRGSSNSISVSGHHNINEGADYCIKIDSQVERGEAV
jgi:hypothetical protein